MPELDRRTEDVLLLYQRCRESKCLPVAGGILDQPEDIMRAFDVIDARVAARKNADVEDRERDEAFEKLRGEMHGRR